MKEHNYKIFTTKRAEMVVLKTSVSTSFVVSVVLAKQDCVLLKQCLKMHQNAPFSSKKNKKILCGYSASPDPRPFAAFCRSTMSLLMVLGSVPLPNIQILATPLIAVQRSN
jgi:hypothetical protein